MHSGGVDAARLAEAVTQRSAASDAPLAVYWCKVEGARESYAERLKGKLDLGGVAILIVRGPRFDNPNSVQDDLRAVVAANRSECEGVADHLGSDECPILVLLGRTPLGIPQASSPVSLPEWFPRFGGMTLPIQIEDLTWTADAPLSAPEARCHDVAEHLFKLEGALLGRLAEVRRRDHNASSAFVELMRRDGEEGLRLEDLVSRAVEFRTTLSTPGMFRPSLKEGRSLVARLWGVVQTEPPERLGRAAKAVASALDLSGLPVGPRYESLTSVLRRPGTPDPTPSRRSARNLLVSIASSCQLLTAAAHADAYSRYPVVLLQSISLDLRLTLDDFEQALRSAE